MEELKTQGGICHESDRAIEKKPENKLKNSI
jgi:hypothetical protein